MPIRDQKPHYAAFITPVNHYKAGGAGRVVRGADEGLQGQQGWWALWGPR